jgi:alkylation response protein AidB-like acyl-CoA dehydrogenase
MRTWGIADLAALHTAAVDRPDWFWPAAAADLAIPLKGVPTRISDDKSGRKFPRWFDGCTLNVADSCVSRWAADPAHAKRPAVVYEADSGRNHPLFIVYTSGTTGAPIRHGSEAMKRKYLPEIAAGRLLMCFGVTEPTSGVDTSRIKTRADKIDGGWLVNGQKVWITNAQNAHRILLLARTSPRGEKRPTDGMTLFFTAMNRTSITARPIEKLGRNAVDTNELFIDNLEIPDEDVVGEVGKGFSYLLDGLNPERIVVCLEQVGLGRRALDLAVAYAGSRIVFDRPIGMNQAVAHPLADSWIRLHAAELVGMDAARLYDAGLPCGPQANAAKFLGSEAGFEACDRAMQTHGGFSYAREYHIERFWRESRLQKFAPISQEMVLNYVSQRVLGLPKSY